MLQAVLQLSLLLRRKAAILRIVFKRATLLGGRHVFVVPQPGASMTRLVRRPPLRIRLRIPRR